MTHPENIDEVTDSEGRHCHTCRACRTVWQHPTPPKGADYEKMHSCPTCGREEYWKTDLDQVQSIDFPWTMGTEFPMRARALPSLKSLIELLGASDE